MSSLVSERKCKDCGKLQPATKEFFPPTHNGYLRRKCRQCTRQYQNEWKRTMSVQDIASWRRRYTARQELMVALKSKPCTDCGGTFPPCAMHFDHISDDKLSNVSTLAGNVRSIKVIMEEVAKCELVCANCHAIRTYERRQIDKLHESHRLGEGREVSGDL